MRAVTDEQQDISFATIESAARRSALHLACRIVEAALNADDSDHTGPSRPCPRCGAAARYAGRRAKTLLTMIGELRCSRAYYVCETCNAGWCPRDSELGIIRGALSGGVTRMVGMTAAMVSFREADELLRELAGLTVGVKTVERAAEALGRDIAADERETIACGAPCSPTMYVGIDGTGVPMRAQEVRARAGKQPDGTAKTREGKLVAVWSADSRDKNGIAVRDPGTISYNAAIESAAMSDTDETASAFADRTSREATRRGVHAAERVVVLGDGARWIWNLTEEVFPEAIQIIDLYHAKGTLSDVAKAIFGAESEFGAAWAKQRRDELEAGRLNDILAALEPHLNTHEQARTCREYILANRHRMQYPQFRRRGLCTSSGVVEAGCKAVVGTRLKRPGMHWTHHGANAIMALRCSKLSGRYDHYCRRWGLAA